MNPALYPLATYPTTFDFAAWVVIAKTSGCDHVRFVVDGPIAAKKYPEYIAWRRFGNILVPLCRLAGMEFSVGETIPGGAEFPYLYGHVEAAHRAYGGIKKLAQVDEFDKSGFITVTLRDSFRNAFRNSNMEAWNKVIATLTQRGKNVMVLRDCEHAPVILEYRMALYANAEMNLGASGGPLTLQHFSDAPYLTFNMAPKRPQGEYGYDPEALMASSGFSFGSQFSFRHARQQLVWKPDTFENIMEAYDEMESIKAAA